MVHWQVLLIYTATSKVTKAPASDGELFVAINTQTGDKQYDTDYIIEKGEYVNLFNLKEYDGKEIDITADNISGNFSTIAVGSVLTYDAATFKFKAGSVTSGVKFTVTAVGGVGIKYVTALIQII